MVFYYKQPQYFDRFRCVGGDCPVTCCAHWSIDWLEHEIEVLKNKDCSEEIRKLIDTSFAASDKEKIYSIKLNDDGECPFHDSDKLCMLQKTMGEECLSHTCRNYPRDVLMHRDTIIRCCYNSCPAVLDLLSEDINSVRLEIRKVPGNFKPTFSFKDDTYERLNNYPILNFRVQLMEFYNKIITCRSISLETAIVLGALASKRFTDAVQKGNYNEIPKIISEYENKLHDKATIAAIEDIKPNPAVQFKFVNNLLITYFTGSEIRINISNLHNGISLLAERYQEGCNAINEAFEGREYFLRNVAANMLMEQNVPFFIKDATILENFAYFALTVAAVKLLSISTAQAGRDVEKSVKRAIAILSRALMSNASYAKGVVADMRNHGFTSAAHVALIIK